MRSHGGFGEEKLEGAIENQMLLLTNDLALCSLAYRIAVALVES